MTPSLAAINRLKLCKCCKSSALACGNSRQKTLDSLTQISLPKCGIWPALGGRTFRPLRGHYSSFRSYGLIRQSQRALPYFGLWPRWRSLCRLSTSPCCPPDLPDVISENLSLDACSRTPAVPQRASACFFRCVVGLPPSRLGSASRKLSA